MNPESAPQPQFENLRPEQHGQEQLQDAGHETVGDHSFEREQGMRQVDRQNGPPLPPPTTAPLPPTPVALPSVQQASDDSAGPAVANDDDLIEKEWVDKAKKIISDTQDNPYERERQINKLQIDYLRKRYGKELGVSN